MRLAFFAIASSCALVLGGVACVDRALDAVPVGTSPPTDGGIGDLSVPGRDGSIAVDLLRAPDLAEAGLTCKGIVECLNTCGPDDCFDACYGKGSSSGRADFDAVSNCVSTACTIACQQSPEQCDACGQDISADPGTCMGRPACGACRMQLAVCGF